MGIKKTVNKITERFMWPGVVGDVKNLVSEFHVYSRRYIYIYIYVYYIVH
jgi:hypothetical protein